MVSKRQERRQAREGALALLYSGDITEQNALDIVENGAYPAEDVKLPEYAEMLVAGVVDHCEEIDRYLSSTSENWAIDRMPVVDRAILRIAVFEMLHVDEVPISVAINEAVELAKAYGGEDESSRFVNGVLGRIARLLENDQATDNAASAIEDDQDTKDQADLVDDPAAGDAGMQAEGQDNGIVSSTEPVE